jgi:CheY-like chemotaxis protein/ligand-binding sensor protein
MIDGAPKPRVLLVEDESIIALSETLALAASGYQAEVASSGEKAVEMALSSPYALVLMDIDLGPGIDGGEAAKRIRDAGGPPVVFLSSHSEESALAKTRDAGAYGFIVKGSGDRILRTSVRMALELSAALRNLAESEGRWASLARNVADYIVSIGPDRRILFSNRPLGGEGGIEQGGYFSSFAVPAERESVDRAIDKAFAERTFARQVMGALGPDGEPRSYEVLFGPAGSPSGAPAKVDYLTAVLRELASPLGRGDGLLSSPPGRDAELEAAITAIDFEPLRGLLEGFAGLTGLQASIVAPDDRFVAATPFARACAAFHRATPSTLAACDGCGRAALAAVLPPDSPGYFEYRCPNGLIDIALPLEVRGRRWGTFFVGQFLYEDDETTEEEFAERARSSGWNVADYLGAIGEVPRISRERMASVIRLFLSLGEIIAGSVERAYAMRLYAST